VLADAVSKSHGRRAFVRVRADRDRAGSAGRGGRVAMFCRPSRRPTPSPSSPRPTTPSPRAPRSTSGGSTAPDATRGRYPPSRWTPRPVPARPHARNGGACPMSTGPVARGWSMSPRSPSRRAARSPRRRSPCRRRR
jgi:hypothetical protein